MSIELVKAVTRYKYNNCYLPDQFLKGLAKITESIVHFKFSFEQVFLLIKKKLKTA